MSIIVKKNTKNIFFVIKLNFQELKINFHPLVLISIYNSFSLTLIIVIHVTIFKLKGYVWNGCLSYPFFCIIYIKQFLQLNQTFMEFKRFKRKGLFSTITILALV